MHRVMAAHILIFAVFLVVYYVGIDFETHFMSIAPVTPLSPLEFAVCTHTLLGDNAIVPRTPLGQILLSLHAAAAWALTIALALSIPQK